MKKVILIIILVSSAALSYALLFTTTDNKTISGTIKGVESMRLVINTKKGPVYIEKENITSIKDDDGKDVTDKYLMVVSKKPIKEAMEKAIVVKDINEMTDREFALYMNDRQIKSAAKISKTVWYACGVNFAIAVLGGAIYYNNALRHPPIPH